jgi:hypothetical protein
MRHQAIPPQSPASLAGLTFRSPPMRAIAAFAMAFTMPMAAMA